VAPTASLNGMRRSEKAKAEVLEKMMMMMMMMSFICSCRNTNERKAIYPKGTSHHTSLFRGPIPNDMKK
jgi:hypothetical protein